MWTKLEHKQIVKVIRAKRSAAYQELLIDRYGWDIRDIKVLSKRIINNEEKC